MKRNAPYQIKKATDWQPHNGKPVYYYVLKNEVTGHIINQCLTTSPVPPHDLRLQQARLNTAAVLGRAYPAAIIAAHGDVLTAEQRKALLTMSEAERVELRKALDAVFD